MDDDPVVRVAHPVVPGVSSPEPVTMTDLLYVHCSACGHCTDYCDDSPEARHRLQDLAKQHANEQHDGLVAAEGWAR